MIHNNYNLAKTMRSNGFSFIHYTYLFDNMLLALLDNKIYQICITNQDWNKLKNIYPKNKIFSNLISEKKHNPKNQINNEIKDEIINHIKNLLEIDIIDNNTKLIDYGFDSIMSIELSTWLQKTYSINISQLEILQGININQIIKSNNINKLKIKNDNSLSDIKIFKKKISNLNIEEDFIEIIEDDNTNYLYKIFSFIVIFFILCYKFVLN